MISSIRHKESISWTFLNDAMAFSAKEMPQNHTDKERFAAALSCIQTGILTLFFPLKRRRSSPSPFISHRVLEAVASWILKSLIFTMEQPGVVAATFGLSFSHHFLSIFVHISGSVRPITLKCVPKYASTKAYLYSLYFDNLQ